MWESLVLSNNSQALGRKKRAQLEAGVPPYVADALEVQARERRKGTTGEAVVHPETHIALDIRPTSFAELARRHAADFRGESGRFGVTYGITQN